jgi:hypothetical protein
MKKYIALYMAPTVSLDKMMKESTPEMRKEGMAGWMKWMQLHQASIVDGGAPAGKNKRVKGNEVSDERNEVCGYTIVQAKSHDAAAAIFKDMPHMMIEGGYVEVVELLPIPSA